MSENRPECTKRVTELFDKNQKRNDFSCQIVVRKHRTNRFRYLNMREMALRPPKVFPPSKAREASTTDRLHSKRVCAWTSQGYDGHVFTACMFTLLPITTTYKVATSLRSVAALFVDHMLFAFPSVSRKTYVCSNFFPPDLLDFFWQTLRGPSSAVSKPMFASK